MNHIYQAAACTRWPACISLAAWKSSNRAENEAILYPNLRPGNEAKAIHIYSAFANSWQNVNIIMPIVQESCICLCIGIMNGTCICLCIGIMNGTCICLCRYHAWYVYLFM